MASTFSSRRFGSAPGAAAACGPQGCAGGIPYCLAPQARVVAAHPSTRLDLGTLLAAVENAPPFAVADVLGDHLAGAWGAREVSFLIADFSGQALIRLGRAGSGAVAREQGHETAQPVPLTGTPQGRALSTQTVELLTEADG